MHINLVTNKGVWLRILDIFFCGTWKAQSTNVTGVISGSKQRSMASWWQVCKRKMFVFLKNNNCTAEIRRLSEIALDPALHATDMRAWELQWMCFRERWLWQELIFRAYEYAKYHLLSFKIVMFLEGKHKEWCMTSHFFLLTVCPHSVKFRLKNSAGFKLHVGYQWNEVHCWENLEG